jgi:hypothetical protein
MSNFADEKPTPVEVWLSQKNMTITCRVVREDESVDELDIDSLSMRGAEREITGWLIEQGYKPDGRWQIEAEDRGEPAETWRRFKLAS